MKKTYVIAEIGINHNGSLELAKKLILQSQESGADAVKFQKRTIELVYTKEDLDRYRESPWGTTNRQQKEGLEFSIEEYKELQGYTTVLGMDFIVSCWDLDSIDVVEKNLNVKYHKIASALATDKKFLEKLNETKKPIICTSTYPTVPEEVNLKHINTLSQKYPNLKVGFSNHYNGVDACVGAVALGAECVEFHITNDRTSYGSDQSASIENSGVLIDAIRKMDLMLGDGIKKVYESEKPIAKKLRKNNDTI